MTLARIGNDRLRDLHLAIVEIEQRAVVVDRGGADDGVVDLELADEVDVAVAPTTPPSVRRTAPPATITSMRGWR